MARKLNLLGKIVVVTVFVLLLAGIIFVADFVYDKVSESGFKLSLPKGVSMPKGGAETFVNGFATAVNGKNFTGVFSSLSSNIPKTVTVEEFSANMEKRFDGVTLSLKEIFTEGVTGFAIFSTNDSESEEDYVTVPLVKEEGEWKIDSFAAEARCTDECTEAICKDDSTLIACEDTNDDGCKEEIEKTCDFVCADGACTTIRQNYVLKLNDITATEPTVQLIDTDADGSATLEVDDDIYIFKKGDIKTIKGLKITMNTVGENSVSVNIVSV